jgi:hypothetical protein
MDGRVTPLTSGAYAVRDGDDPDDFDATVGKQCDCPQALQAPSMLCVHKLAVGIYRRAKALVHQHNPLAEPELPVQPTAEPATAHDSTKGSLEIPAKYYCTIKGKQAIKYDGLLWLALQRGLVSLEAEWIANTDTLSLAVARAKFKDGRSFMESGDATPDNVTAFVKDHFRRVALTRAKARALSDALGVDLVAAEELAD